MSQGKASQIRCRLREVARPSHAKALQWYFKTGPGDYGEGDRFIGVRVPGLRRVVREIGDTDQRTIQTLLRSPIHEERMVALLLLVRQFERGDAAERERIVCFYLGQTDRINNWDLVDLSAPTIIGGWFLDRDRTPLHALARSSSLWERRIAVLACFAFIRQKEFADAFRIAKTLLTDPHDLIHKAVGWMLREIGKRDRAALEAFLASHYRRMPRTMLRYAIERLPEPRRQAYLKGRIGTDDKH
jgi:3-methyladenine DNA glycosylase AlkD